MTVLIGPWLLLKRFAIEYFFQDRHLFAKDAGRRGATAPVKAEHSLRNRDSPPPSASKSTVCPKHLPSLSLIAPSPTTTRLRAPESSEVSFKSCVSRGLPIQDLLFCFWLTSTTSGSTCSGSPPCQQSVCRNRVIVR